MLSTKALDQDVEGVSRRRFLKWGLAGVAGLAIPLPSYASLLSGGQDAERVLSLFNPHTGESLRTTYWASGTYVPDGVNAINHILRDYHTNQVVEMDTHLFDLLYVLHRRLGVKDPFHIVSGYRSPQTNAALRKLSHNVAKHSLHIEGMAADICMPRFELSHLHRMALSLKQGGVGYYPHAGFVHVDVGPVRHWQL